MPPIYQYKGLNATGPQYSWTFLLQSPMFGQEARGERQVAKTSALKYGSFL